MSPEIERTIIHYYPNRALTSPVQSDDIGWDYDPDHRTLERILEALEERLPEVKPGDRGGYDISEELVLAPAVRLQLCYLGPYAAINHRLPASIAVDGYDHGVVRLAREVLRRNGVTVLDQSELDEVVPWIQVSRAAGQAATVWDCLFGLGQA